MKQILCLLMSFVLMAGVTIAQTASPATTNAAPAASVPPKKHPDVSSVTPKTPTTVPDPGDAKWLERATKNIADASASSSSIDVIFDGDSITDWWQHAGKSVWTDTLAKYRPVDFGIAGDTTQNLLWRLAHGQAQGLHPKVIFLLIGTNDMKFTSTPQEIADGVKEIIHQYQKICPGTVIILQAIFPRAESATDPYRLKVNATNPLLGKLADGEKVIYLDLAEKFLAPDGTLPKDIMPDFLHPSKKGYAIWAAAITPLLDKYTGSGSGKRAP